MTAPAAPHDGRARTTPATAHGGAVYDRAHATMESPQQNAFGPGTLLGNDYRIVRLLATGSMGSVFVAEQVSTGVERAIKVIKQRLVGNPKAHERFTNEARVCARLESEHIVRVLGAGVHDPGGVPWIAMELLKGRPLSALARERGRLPREEVREILRQLCDGLAVAHAAGVVHRDLKLENVFIAAPTRGREAFTVKVLDFGIAKVNEEFSGNLTAAVGSPMWMAPEQARQGVVSPATDVWPLGLIAFRLLTGASYWRAAVGDKAPVQAVLTEVVRGELPAASARAAEIGCADALPPGFDAWFARCVVRDPAARFADAEAAGAALESVLGASALGAPAAAPAGPTREAAPVVREPALREPPALPTFPPRVPAFVPPPGPPALAAAPSPAAFEPPPGAPIFAPPPSPPAPPAPPADALPQLAKPVPREQFEDPFARILSAPLAAPARDAAPTSPKSAAAAAAPPRRRAAALYAALVALLVALGAVAAWIAARR